MPYKWRDLSKQKELSKYDNCKFVISLALGRGGQPAYWIDVYKNQPPGMGHPVWHIARQWSFVKKDKSTGREEVIEGEHITKNIHHETACADMFYEYAKKKIDNQWKILGMNPMKSTEKEDEFIFTRAANIQWEGINRTTDPNLYCPRTPKEAKILKSKRFKDLQLKRQAKAKW